MEVMQDMKIINFSPLCYDFFWENHFPHEKRRSWAPAGVWKPAVENFWQYVRAGMVWLVKDAGRFSPARMSLSFSIGWMPL
jgi:hypothetical protein